MSTDLQPDQKNEVKEGLPRLLSFSIWALVAITLITIVALFLDSIENRGARITMTFVVFAIFVGVTAFDTLRGSKRSWYAPAALLANGVFLGASILTIWLTQSPYWGFTFVTLFHIVVYLGILRLGILFGMLAMNAIDREAEGHREVQAYERKASLWAAWLGGAAAALFVIYIAANQVLSGREINFGLYTFWEFYIRLSTAVLILAGLGLSISFLLRWFFSADERAARRAELAGQAHIQNEWAWQYDHGLAPAAQPQKDWTGAQSSRGLTPGIASTGKTVYPMEPSQPLLPWPTFEDGRPFPVGRDGQPDFEAANREIASNRIQDQPEVRTESTPPQAPVAPSAPKDQPVASQNDWSAPAPRNSDGWQQPQAPQGWAEDGEHPRQ